MLCGVCPLCDRIAFGATIPEDAPLTTESSIVVAAGERGNEGRIGIGGWFQVADLVRVCTGDRHLMLIDAGNASRPASGWHVTGRTRHARRGGDVVEKKSFAQFLQRFCRRRRLGHSIPTK